MKRCPKCDFIYEDDQSLCDMDGVLLVFDSRTLPNLPADQTVPAVKPSPKRNRAVPAFATLILALVLGMVYYVSTQRRATQNPYTPALESAPVTSNPTPEVIPGPEAQPSTEEPKPEPSKTTAKTTSTTSPVKKAPARTDPKQAQSKADEKKDNSKVGNILKKTGHILKKPFKF